MNETFTQQFDFNGITQPPVVFQQTRQLMGLFRLLAVGLLVWYVYALADRQLGDVCGALIITCAALLPGYLWCSGRAPGLPIFPLYALTFVWTYALPLLGQQSVVFTYDGDERLFACVTVCGYLLLGTAAWFHFVTRPHPLPEVCLAMTENKGDRFFVVVLFVSVLFTIASVGGWFAVSAGIFALIRGVVLGLHALGVFVLSYRWGRRQLSRSTTVLVLILLLAHVVASITSLYLITGMTTFILSVIAFTIGRQRIPWAPTAVVIICFALLHVGKGQMRAKYWFGGQSSAVQVWNYPVFFSEWLGDSYDTLAGDEERQGGQSLLERSSLLQLLLKAQRLSPDTVPYMYGDTYGILPKLLIPRILYPEKFTANEGTYRLSIHYGLQTRADTATTAIAWGLLNEAYANFGLFGCAGLAILLGGLCGTVAAWSRSAPTLSLRSFIALLILSFSMQTEMSAGVYVSALFQSLVALGGVALIFMARQPVAAMDRLG